MEMREGVRVDSVESCYLHQEDSVFPATLLNISTTGILVSCSNVHLQPGNKCGIYLTISLNKAPCEFRCEVVRVDESGVAMKFIDGR